MPATPSRSYPYPTLDNSPNAPLDIQALAQALDVDVAAVAALAEYAEARARAASASVVAGALVIRNAEGLFSVAPPLADTHAAPRGYVDGAVSDLPATKNRADAAYQAVQEATASAVAEDRLVRRNTDGRFSVLEPAAPTHPATRAYADSAAQDAAAGRGYGYFSGDLSVPAGGNVSVAVSFPAGRFPSVPGVVATAYNTAEIADLSTHIVSASLSSATVSIRNNGSNARTCRAHVIAMQRG